MSKAYLLVICLLAASFTGCLADDTSDSIEQEENTEEQNTEEETIEPVGTNNNETEDYSVLIAEIQNLTNEIEALKLEIKEMQSSKYDVPENSSIWIQQRHAESRDYEIIKNGSTITVEYRGDIVNNYFNTTYPRNCTVFTPPLSFANVDGVIIKSFNAGSTLWTEEGGEFWMDGVEIIRECALHEDYTGTMNIGSYWSTIVITLPEEPTRVETESGYYTFY